MLPGLPTHPNASKGFISARHTADEHLLSPRRRVSVVVLSPATASGETSMLNHEVTRVGHTALTNDQAVYSVIQTGWTWPARLWRGAQPLRITLLRVSLLQRGQPPPR